MTPRAQHPNEKLSRAGERSMKEQQDRPYKSGTALKVAQCQTTGDHHSEEGALKCNVHDFPPIASYSVREAARFSLNYITECSE